MKYATKRLKDDRVFHHSLVLYSSPRYHSKRPRYMKQMRLSSLYSTGNHSSRAPSAHPLHELGVSSPRMQWNDHLR